MADVMSYAYALQRMIKKKKKKPLDVFIYFVSFFLFQEVVWSRPTPPQKPPSEGNTSKIS